MRIISPTPGTVGQLGSSLRIAVEATIPPGCTDAPGLESKLVLTVVNVSGPGDPVLRGDSRVLDLRRLVGNGGIFAKVGETNIERTWIWPKGRFQKKGQTYRLCIAALAAETAEAPFPLPPPAGEVCQDITTK